MADKCFRCDLCFFDALKFERLFICTDFHPQFDKLRMSGYFPMFSHVLK